MNRFLRLDATKKNMCFSGVDSSMVDQRDRLINDYLLLVSVTLARTGVSMGTSIKM